MADSNGKTNNANEAKLNLIQANGHTTNGDASFPASQKGLRRRTRRRARTQAGDLPLGR